MAELKLTNNPCKCCIRKPDKICPFCSGKEVSFGSSQLTVKKEEGLAVVYDDEGVAANFKWKFCPECGKKFKEVK